MEDDMKIDKIPTHVLRDVRERGFADAAIERMSADELFNEYLIWNGIIGYGFNFYHTVIELHDIEKGA
jgi:hypothetical protein